MKARPLRVAPGENAHETKPEHATHVMLNVPGGTGALVLPVILRGTRDGTHCWTWNGDTEAPTLRPSVLTTRQHTGFRCHSWINDGCAQFLDDCSHDLRGQTVPLEDGAVAALQPWGR